MPCRTTLPQSFHDVAATLGSEEACRNAGAYPSVSGCRRLGAGPDQRHDTPARGETPTGDSLVYADLLQLGAALESIPTNDTNIGPATGIVIIDPDSLRYQGLLRLQSKWVTSDSV